MVGVIVIIFVMLIVNAFLINAILNVSSRVNDKVNKHFLFKVSSIIPPGDEKRRKASDDDDSNTKEVIVEKVSVYSDDFKEERAVYKTNDFIEDYKDVKERMSFDPNDVIKDIIEENAKKANKAGAEAIDLVKTLDLETVYSLNTLAPNIQKAVLKSAITPIQNKLLDSYVASNHGMFDVIGFYEYINAIAKQEDPIFYVKTGSQQDYYDDLAGNIITIHDPSITEGIKVVHKNKVYDYSI